MAIKGFRKPPHIVVELPGREPYIVWSATEAIDMAHQFVAAIEVFYEEMKSVNAEYEP